MTPRVSRLTSPGSTALATPPVRRIVPDGVFDAFGWCASDTLDWCLPAGRPLDLETPVTAANPPGMVFVMRGDCDFLPRELASLHVPGVGRGDGETWALAPWGIDDATDRLFEHRVRPRDLLWLATGSIAGVFWGLHDWAHFHSHGPFEKRAWTELQCDATALAWAWGNRGVLGLSDEGWERIRREVVGVNAERFADGESAPGADRSTPDDGESAPGADRSTPDGGVAFEEAWLAAERMKNLLTA